MRGLLERAACYIAQDALIVNASKGIELETLKTVSRICTDILGRSCVD
jgi:glycerol-3-phosphate dehydrogenase